MNLLNHTIIHKEDMVWEEGMYENTEMAYLWEDEETGRYAFLVRLYPGASIPFHDHPRREVAFLLEGEVQLNDDIMRKGDFLTAIGDEAHDVYSDKGCVFFIYIDYNMSKFKVTKIAEK